MAIWQYSVYLLPESWLRADGSVAGLVVDSQMMEHPPLQLGLTPVELEQLITAYLPRRPSWHEKLQRWGDDQRDDDVDVWYEKDQVTEIRVRLDLRNITTERIAKLLELTQNLKCIFVDACTGDVALATKEALLDSIRRSHSAKFVTDPHRYLESLGDGRTVTPKT